MIRARSASRHESGAPATRLPHALALWWPGLGQLAQRRYRRAFVLLAISIPLAGWTFDSNAYEALGACAWGDVSPCFLAAWAGFALVWGWGVLDVRALR
ncbi:hypothetical protein MYXO_02516 [Myxococcaceae bacterium]|jgi:hypothetical protein|nr:hypothetical protein MYXO_02516 [Myxococcaceae bacterium]